MTALMMSPTMFCIMRTVMAVAHCSVIMRPPKPMVTWTSMENRKAEVNDLRQDAKFCFVLFWSNNVFPFFQTQHLT